MIPIRNTLIETLQAEGLEVVAHPGVEFDPERHEAIMHEAKDELETTTVMKSCARVTYGRGEPFGQRWFEQ